MSKITVLRNPSPDQLKELGVSDWPIWTKETSEFPWSYDEPETCYFLEGDVVVTPEGQEPVESILLLDLAVLRLEAFLKWLEHCEEALAGEEVRREIRTQTRAALSWV